MLEQPGDVSEEIKSLRRCINDLVSLLGLPAMWSGGESSQIILTLLDALQRMLQLDLVYVRLKDPGGDAPIEMVRFGRSQKRQSQPHEIGEALKHWLEADPQKQAPLIRNPIGDGDLSIVPMGLGLHGEIGVLVAGSERADFPRQTERLILNVAANQASIGLQEARRLSEQKRVASELDRRVAQRTSELAAANVELRAEIAERKAIEKRLLESEALLKNSETKLRQVIDALPTLAWCNMPDGPNEFLNKGWHEYTGLSPEESHGWGWQVAFHPDDLPPLLKRWQELLVSGEPGEIEARLRRYDGVFRWFLIRVSPYRDETGKIARWYGTSTDIDDRKRAEDGLRRSEARHRVVVETASDAVVSIHGSGGIISANAATKGVFGYEPSELIGQPLTILMPEYLRDLHQAGFKRYLATSHRHIDWQGVELTGLRKNGEEFPVEISFGEFSDDGHQVFTGFIRDISKRKQAEEALRARERDLSLIIETIPGLVWCAAPDGELNYLNRRILDYTGTSSDAWAGLGWKNLLHPDDREPTARQWSRAVATGQPYQIQCRLRRSDGVHRWFQALGQPARDDQGVINRWYGLLIDIDDRKNAEENLRNAQARLMRATQAATIAELSASIAHEINQPLAAVVASGHACLRFLAAQPANLADAREAAESIVRDGKDIGEIVRRIRALFKRTTLDKFPVNVNDIIGEVLRLLDGEITKRRVSVETDLWKDAPLVSVDRVQLQQLILNLLMNGMEAMDPVHDRPRKLWIRSRPESPARMLIEVRDYGVGLKDHPDKLFEAFFTTKENGMGMGLAICRSIVEAHNGRLWAVSQEGAGAAFCFTLPVEASAAP